MKKFLLVFFFLVRVIFITTISCLLNQHFGWDVDKQSVAYNNWLEYTCGYWIFELFLITIRIHFA